MRLIPKSKVGHYCRGCGKTGKPIEVGALMCPECIRLVGKSMAHDHLNLSAVQIVLGQIGVLL